MKLSLAIAAIILVVGSLFGWQERQHLTTLREEHRQLVKQALALGLTPDTADEATKTSRSNAKQLREAQQAADARAFAAEVIAFARDMKAAQESGDTNTQREIQKRTIVLMDRLLSLDKAQLEILIDEVRRSTDLDDDMRQGIVGFSIMMLANDHPEAALALYTGSSDMIEPGGMNEHVISSALSKWAQRDPLAALEWIRENSAKHPKVITDGSKRGVIAGTAVQDPRLAFKLIDELEFKDPGQAAKAIARAAHSSTQRTAMLNALRDHLETVDDESTRQQLRDGMLNDLGSRMAHEGFDSSMKWLSENELTGAEIAAFSSRVSHRGDGEDTGRWIGWMADKLPAESLDLKVSNMVAQWAQEDYASAGIWLNDATGPVKVPAIRGYARAVAPYEPETAANWALTLPAGDQRTDLLKTIHTHWKSQDEPAAARFAEQHGLDNK